MRVSDHRYDRDRQRIDIALRFIRHEARTRTIRVWTGLTNDRIRKLFHSYPCTIPGVALSRHRGKSPQQSAFFMRTLRVRQEAALLASLYRLLGVLPVQGPTAPPPGVARAELLCHAYEAYRDLVPQPLIGFEHAVLLVTALAAGDEITLAHCRECAALVVADRLALRPTRCAHCAATPTDAEGRQAAANIGCR
jgi:hypothetical protein